MASYIFKPPTVDEAPVGVGPLFSRFKVTNGVSVIKVSGVYSTVRTLDSDLIPTYQEFYQGGGNYTVGDTVRLALIAGGIGVTSANFTLI